MNHVPSNKGRKLPPEILRDAEVQPLIRACSHKAPSGIRNRGLIVTPYRGGLRIREALDLYPKDLDPKARTVGLDAASFAVISRWMDERRRIGIN